MKILNLLSFHFISRTQRLKRRLRGCCLFLILGGLLACSGLVYLVRVAAAQPADGSTQEILLLIDNSNSMFTKNGLGSDPNLLRIEAARLFITYLGVDSAGPPHRLGVIFFGGEAELVVPPTPLTDDDRRAELIRRIEQPAPRPWTDQAAALTLAAETFKVSSPTTRKQAVVLLTDGKPEWDDTPTQTEKETNLARLRKLAGRFAARDIPLFIILLQNEATDADPEIEALYVPLWQEMAAATPPGRFYRARQSEALLDIYHDIVVTLTGRQSEGVVIQRQIQAETLERVPVEPGLAQMSLVIRKSDPAITVEISPPSGPPLEPTDPKVQYAGRSGQSREEIWTFADPPAGIWQVHLNGSGHVTVWKDFYPAPPTPTPTFTPTPTVTPPPTSTATPVPRPTATVRPTTTLTTGVVARYEPPAPPPAGAAPTFSPPTPVSQRRGWVVLAGLFVVGTGSWLWLHQRRTRPLLTGVLRQITVPAPVELTEATRLDLDRLGRRAASLGPAGQADLYLPDTPDQPTPPARLIAHCTAEDPFGVNLVPEPAESASTPIQVNNSPIHHTWPLRDGDVITLGAYRFKYENLRQRQAGRR